jgi:hypothetical protein
MARCLDPVDNKEPYNSHYHVTKNLLGQKDVEVANVQPEQSSESTFMKRD